MEKERGNRGRKRGIESKIETNNEEIEKGWDRGGRERGGRDKGEEGERKSGRGGSIGRDLGVRV
jgi:hypothetical protein